MANRSKHKPSQRSAQKNANKGTKQKNSSGSIRIVAGHWRGRKIPVINADGLRPTGDRMRESVFNWLQFDIPGRRCLDLFAGSGALGLEAASRGAASVTLVESSEAAVAQLRSTLDTLDAPQSVSLYAGTAQAFLASHVATFDIVFIDPPFDKRLHLDMLRLLIESGLPTDALVYVEIPNRQRDIIDPMLPTWELIKEKRFGEVTAMLVRQTH